MTLVLEGSTASQLVLNSFGGTGGFGLACSHEAFPDVVGRALPAAQRQRHAPSPRLDVCPACYEQSGPPVAPIQDGRATPQPLRNEGMAMTIVEAAPGITGGVDTHLDNHVVAPFDPFGRLVGAFAIS